MRKYVIGALIGAVLMASGQAFAESISLVGKKISNEYKVVVDGKELPVKAVSINGTSYTPNRALADALDQNIEFKDNTVIFSEKEVSTVETGTIDPTKTYAEQLEEIDAQYRELKKQRAPYEQKDSALRVEWNTATPERRLEIESELKQIELEVKPINDKIDALFDYRNKLEAQQ